MSVYVTIELYEAKTYQTDVAILFLIDYVNRLSSLGPLVGSVYIYRIYIGANLFILKVVFRI